MKVAIATNKQTMTSVDSIYCTN